MSFWTVYRVECRRALARRAVRVLILIALAGCVIAGVVALVQTEQAEVLYDDAHVARLDNLWRAGGEDSTFLVTILFLGIGALIGGSTVAGGDWRAGSIATLVTWVPSRLTLLGARFLAIGSLAAVISVLLQAALVLALLPVILIKGDTSGIDGEWLISLGAFLLRSMSLCALAALVGATIANIGRNTTATLGVAFVWMAIVEAIVRGVWPERARFLLGENIATFLTWEQLDGTEFQRGPLVAAITLTGYAALLLAVSLALFQRRDIASVS